MAKKKRKRHRRPVAPPVHSAPDVLHGPAGTPPGEPPPSRPFAPEPPPTATEPETYTPAPSAVRAREAARRRDLARRRRGRRRAYIITGVVILAIVAAVLVRQTLSRRETNQFNELARASGCSELRVTGGSGASQHLRQGQTTDYDTSPPTHGAHDGSGVVRAGVYASPFSDEPQQQPSIYRAVHSLEHGYVIIWHDRLTRDQERALEREYRTERKVIVVPYPDLEGKNKVALTAWGRSVYCQKPSTKVIDAFIDQFREARTAPEPKAG